jgi:uncharacterized OB-fold protein
MMTVRRRRRLQLLPGHCRKCGYDLRASADTCPECGTRIPFPWANSASHGRDASATGEHRDRLEVTRLNPPSAVAPISFPDPPTLSANPPR